MDSKGPSSASPAPFQGLSTDAKPPLAHFGNQDPLGLEAGHGGTGADGASLPPDQIVILEKSIGVQRIEATKSVFTWRNLLFVYAFFALLSWSLSLDQYTNSTYLATATSVSFDAHSLLAAINAIKAVVQSVSQPPIAKLSDVVGRVETYFICVLLYTIGYIIVAAAPNIYAYAAGTTINVFGITGLFLLQSIVIADMSSLRDRLFWSIFPSIPGCINVWVSGNVAESILSTSTWRWGIGMFTILTPALSFPIIMTLHYGQHKAKVEGKLEKIPHFFKGRKISVITLELFWQLDFVGLILLVVGAGLILLTVTIANGLGSSWNSAHCIVMLIVGGLSFIAFLLWEVYFARHPVIPLKLLTNRTVIASMLIALFHPMAGAIAQDYFYTFLYVAANESTLSATRISSVSAFVSILAAVAAGVFVRYFRYLKPIIIVGACFDILGLGLMIRFRGSFNSGADLVITQVLRGIAEGFIGFPTQAAIQATTKHEHLAAITATYLAIYYLSGGIGYAISGGIWTNILPSTLQTSLGPLADSAYSDPFTFADTYAPGTPERDALSQAQSHSQRIICIVATCVAAVTLFLTFPLQNPRLPDTQSRPEAEVESTDTDGSHSASMEAREKE